MTRLQQSEIANGVDTTNVSLDYGSATSPSYRRFAIHCAFLLCILLTLIPIVDNSSFTSPDEGLYAAQADALSQGSWSRERPATDVDSDGRWTALLDGVIAGPRAIPYSRRPLYPIILTTLWRLGGVGGGLLVSVVGSFVAAVVTALVAGILDHRARLWTLWLVGVGSPLFYDAFLVVGHSLAAALSATLTLAVIGVVGPHDDDAEQHPMHFWMWATLGWIAAIPLTLLRTEGVIVVLGFAAATVLGACSIRRVLRPPSIRCLIFAGVLGVIGVVTYLANDTWARAVTDSTSKVGLSSIDRDPDPIAVVWTSLLRPWHPDNRFASASMVLIAMASVTAPLLFRWLPRLRTLGAGLLALAAGAAFLRFLQEPPGLVSGLVPAMPWLLVGLLSLDGASSFTRPSRTLLITAAAVVFAIVLTSYGVGGANEWGGRFFHVIIPIVAPVAVLGLLRLSRTLPTPERRVVLVSVLFMSVCLGGAAIRANAHVRNLTLQMRLFMTRTAASADSDLAVVSQINGSGAQRMLWQVRDDGIDLLTSDGLANLHLLLDDVPTRRDRIVVFSDAPSVAVAASVLGADSEWVIDSELDGPGELMDAFVLKRAPEHPSERTDGSTP